MLFWAQYPPMEHNENCECCRCVQIPQKPYEDACDEKYPVERYNPCVYHHYSQSPCTTCGRTHFQQSTSVVGTLPLDYESSPGMASFQSLPRKSMMSRKSVGKSISISQNRMSMGYNRQSIRHNGLDDDEDDFGPQSLALQTCKETGVGDCPACTGTRTACHENECQLCCEVKVCGPNFRNCPFNPDAETQTDMCAFLGVPCECLEPCGLDVCNTAERCGMSGIECRCINKSCNTSRHCIIVENDDNCSFTTNTECQCTQRGCSVARSCVVLDEDEFVGEEYTDFEEPFPMQPSIINHSEQLYDADEIIRRCHALCQTTNPDDRSRPSTFNNIKSVDALTAQGATSNNGNAHGSLFQTSQAGNLYDTVSANTYENNTLSESDSITVNSYEPEQIVSDMNQDAVYFPYTNNNMAHPSNIASIISTHTGDPFEHSMNPHNLNHPGYGPHLFPDTWAEQNGNPHSSVFTTNAGRSKNFNASSRMNPAYMDRASMNSAAISRASMNPSAMGRASMNPAAMGRVSMNPAAMGRASVNPAAMGRASMNPAAMGRASMNPAAMGRASMNPATMGRASMYTGNMYRASVKPSRMSRRSASPSKYRQSVGGGILGHGSTHPQNITYADDLEFFENMTGESPNSGPRRICVDGPMEDYDAYSFNSYISGPISTIDYEPPSSGYNVGTGSMSIGPAQTADSYPYDSYGVSDVPCEESAVNYEVTLEEVPMANGDQKSRISIRAKPATSKPMSANVEEPPCGLVQTDVPHIYNLKSKQSTRIVPTGATAENVASGKNTGHCENEKSQVHFNIDIVDGNKDRTIILKRSVQSQSKINSGAVKMD